MRLSIKNPSYTLIIIFLIIIVALMMFFVWPIFKSIEQDSNELLAEKNNAAILQIESDQIEQFKKQYQNYKPDLDTLNQVFVDRQNPVDFIKFLELTASSVGITPEISIATGSANSQKDQNSVLFQLFANDDFLKIMRLIKAIENGPYLVEIQTISMKSTKEPADSKNTASGKVESTLFIKAFAKK